MAIFSVFFLPLVFEAAQKELPLVTLLATVGVVRAAPFMAFAMRYAMECDWGSALVFGVLIAATDPVSVIATFNESKVLADCACWSNRRAL